MNPILRLVLKLLSSPKINMQEDYEKVRKVQAILARSPKNKYKFLDRAIYSTEDGHEIPVRVFYPEEKRSDEVILFFHGGGWVLGGIDTYTKDCIKMADRTGRVILSVDYRKAPENPFPAGFEDCYRVTEVLFNNLNLIGVDDYRKVTLMGNSAGANLAAVVSMRLRDEGKIVPHKQILVNPVTYWYHQEDAPFLSVDLYGQDYGLTRKKMQEYMDMYEPDIEKRKNPYISPLMAKDFTNQPKTLLISSEFDLLRDEGEAYGRELKAAGNEVRIFRANGTVHNYLYAPIQNEIVDQTYDLIHKYLDDQLEGSEKNRKQSETST
ncbi:alpha/beta hydrolase [Jeotgalibaca caeni]|uniref:alpha/beta hydrolase n=1 Tax=Jeotgalibaca caeni TaxID=3028623 RepID=UPI00237EAAAD|nr:alpha/beta hydrolase [Jeotgalibaca caeni]MDE1548353.1 alpha/beta hydrolase [Jeotgalibaca caeni]